MSASFQESNQNSCPLQFAREQPVKTCTTNNYANQNVTVMMKRLYNLFIFFRIKYKFDKNDQIYIYRCDGRPRCVFSFSQLPRFLCVLDNAKNQIIDARFTNINITYFCILPRKRCNLLFY